MKENKPLLQMTRLGDWHFFVNDRLPLPGFIRHEELLRMDTIKKVFDFAEKLVTPCVSSRADDVLNNRTYKLLLTMEITDYITQVKHKDARDAREGLFRLFSDTSVARTATLSSERLKCERMNERGLRMNLRKRLQFVKNQSQSLIKTNLLFLNSSIHYKNLQS